MAQNLKDDFYSFVNYNWLNETIIPSDKSRYGTFNILDDTTKDKLKKLIEESINSEDINYKKIGTLYKQGLKLEKKNYTREFKLINNIINHIDISLSCNILFDNIINIETRFGITMPFCVYVGPDFVDSNMNILYISSSGLGLSREYYIIDKPDYVEKREEYKKFLKEYSKLFRLDIDIDKYYDLEKTLAEKTLSKEDKRNIDKVNNPILWEEFIKLYPKFSFIKHVFSETKNDNKMNICNLEYITLLNSMINDTNLELWKQYFKLKFVLDINSYLSEQVYLVYFNFYGKIMNGRKEPEPLWKRSITKCQNILGELIGDLYRKIYFSKESKSKAYELVDFIKKELHSTLNNLQWMEQQTKDKAISKLNKMNVKIGYPEKLEKNYSRLEIDSNKSYLENMLWSNIFLNKYELSYLYKPVNKEKWEIDSYEVNAYYNPSSNEIVFPAGILQEPFFSSYQSDEKNFGGIGTVIGHEITHGFDDMGSRFDENGNLNNWWSDNDKIKYKDKTDIIKDQYNQFMIEGNNVNGKLTLGENIADIGGVHIAYKALQSYLKDNNKDNYDLKEFFINYANIWKNKATSEYAKEMLLIDPHSPAIFRVNGTLSNIDEFYKVFDINEGDKLFIPKEKRGKIWV